MSLVVAVGHTMFGDSVPAVDEWISRRYARRLECWGSPQVALAAHIQHETLKMQRLQRLAALYAQQGRHDKAQQQLARVNELSAIIQERQALLQQYASGAVPVQRVSKCGTRRRGCCGSNRSCDSAADSNGYMVMPASPVAYATTETPVPYGATATQMPPAYPAAAAGQTIY